MSSGAGAGPHWTTQASIPLLEFNEMLFCTTPLPFFLNSNPRHICGFWGGPADLVMVPDRRTCLLSPLLFFFKI
jgi:hypothetical protein